LEVDPLMAKRDATKKKQPWRENLEAVTMAIAVALLFKTFVLEVSKIPSGSMQPTLMGSPAANVFDRVLVDKLSFAYRDPERWEIVVFKHPIERSRVMVKRLVGMPEEQLRIEFGDVWTRKADADPWTIERRPPAVMGEHWKRIDVDEPARSSWEPVSGAGWRTAGREIVARGDGIARFRPEERSIVDHYADGYIDALRAPVLREAAGRRVREGLNPVGDLRLEGDVEALAGTTQVSFELAEGLRTYEFRLPGPGADAGARPEIRVRDSATYGGAEAPARRDEVVATGEPFRLPAGDEVEFAVENLDDRLRLEVDGDVLIELAIDAASDQRSSVAIAVRGAGADFTDLELLRDLYYVPQDLPRGMVAIPADHFFFLGDNTLDSADGRDWKSTRMRFTDPNGAQRVMRGNYRGQGENPAAGRDSKGVAFTGFRDEWGNSWWMPSDRVQRDLEASAPLVPRQLIQGRALATFWPLQPWKGVMRLGWLH
jgi:signal peptidase I